MLLCSLKFIWKCNEHRKIKITFKKKNKCQGLSLSFKTYPKVPVIKIVQYWCRNKQIYQWNKIEDTEIDPHTYGQLIFDRDIKVIQ